MASAASPNVNGPDIDIARMSDYMEMKLEIATLKKVNLSSHIKLDEVSLDICSGEPRRCRRDYQANTPRRGRK
jgi:hypothetical protein